MERQHIEGRFGCGHELGLPDVPENAATVCHWLITSPFFCPLWQQWAMYVVRLADLPGFPEANKSIPQVTHEIGVVALDPAEGPQSPRTMTRYMTPGDPWFGKLPYLEPQNIASQVIGTDDELNRLAPHLVRAVVCQGVTPETAGDPDLVRGYWANMISLGLDHMRGEHAH